MANKPRAFTPGIPDILEQRHPRLLREDERRQLEESQRTKQQSAPSGRQHTITSKNNYILQETINLVSDSALAAKAYIRENQEPSLDERFAADAEAKSRQVSEQEFFALWDQYQKDSRAAVKQALFSFMGVNSTGREQQPLLFPMEQPKSLTLTEQLYGNEDFYIIEVGVRMPRPKPEDEKKALFFNNYQRIQNANQQQRDAYVAAVLADENFLAIADQGAQITEQNPPYAYTLLSLAEQAIYNYYIAKGNQEAARNFLQTFQTVTSRREGRDIADGLDKIDSTLLRWLAKAGIHLGAGLENGVKGIDRAGLALQSHRAMSFDYQAALPSSLEYASQTSLERSGEGGKMVGQLLYAAGDMAPGMALSAAVGNPAGLAAYTFVSSLGNTYMSCIMEGKSDLEASTTGMLTGLVDAGLQYAMGSVGAKAESAITKGVKSKFSKMVAKVCDNPTVAGAVNAGGQWMIDAGAQGITEYAQHIFAELIYKAASGERSSVDLFSEDALQALFIGSLLGGIYNLGNIPKDYQMQAMGTVALQTEGVTNGLMTLAGQSRSLEVLEAAREANRTADPMAYGRLMLAVQKELGLTYKRGGGASSLRSNAKELAAYMREKGQIGDPMIAELLEQGTQPGFTSQANDGMMNESGMVYENSDIPKPYAKSRPSYARGQVEQVWENAKDPITGKVYDPTGVIITWDTTKPRKGQWDMGHIPGQNYNQKHALYMQGKLSKEEFLKWYRDPANYRPELPSTNRSHKYE